MKSCGNEPEWAVLELRAIAEASFIIAGDPDIPAPLRVSARTATLPISGWNAIG